MANTPLENIDFVAQGLGALCAEVVFVGGATLELYLDNAPSRQRPDIRPTLDVDCVIQTSSNRKDFYEWEEKVRNLGFNNAPGPIGRFIYKGIIVDFMPTDAAILGFTNPWYKAGIQNAATTKLSSGTSIRFLPIEYFVATKCTAFLDRGAADLYASKDLEDIVFLLAYGSAIREKLEGAPWEIKEALDKVREKIEGSHSLMEIIEAHIDRKATAAQKQQVVDLLSITQ